MGCKLSKHLNSNKSPEAVHSYGCESSSIIELLKPECLKAKKTRNKRQVHQKKMNDTKFGKWTLEDWLLASPSLKAEHFKGGELCVLKHASKRVHPSVSLKAGESFYVESLSVPDQAADKEDCFSAYSKNVSSISRTQSGKSEKRVSFKLPEEADIFIFYSPQDSLETDQDCFV